MLNTPSGLLVFTLLVAGAVYRLTVLAVRDAITGRFRAAVQRRYTGVLVNTFTRCVWCLSVWLAFGVAAGAYYGWRYVWVRLSLVALTAAGLTGYFAEKEG